MQRQNTIQSRKSGFFDELMSNSRYLNRSYFHCYAFDKNKKFKRSNNYNSYRNTYADRLKLFQRSKTVDDTNQSTAKFSEDLKPDRSYFTLLRIVMVAFGMECLFCLQEALTVPLLLKLKVPETLYSLVYLLIPLLGFFFQPVIGVLSDRCQSKLGPRRPFILMLSLSSLIGLLFILNGSDIANYLSHKSESLTSMPHIPYLGIAIACLGVAMLNFSSDSSNNSCRALVIDNCNQEDQESGLNLMSLVCSIGSLFGYVLGAIDWGQTFFKFFGDDMNIISIFASVIVLVCLIITLTSIEETPLVLNDYNDDDDDDQVEENTEASLLIAHCSSQKRETKNLIDEENLKNKIQKFNDYLEENEEDEDQPITLSLLYKSVLNMPKELCRLLVCHLLGWMSIWSFCLFFTDFVAQTIYGGHPSSEPGSKLFILYDEGVKMGCWGLVCASLVSAFSAVILEKYLISCVSTKTLYFWSHLIYAVTIGLIFFQSNIYIIIALATSYGIVLNINMVLPYQMISEFHQDDEYRNKSTSGTKRGIGIDCALLSSVYFLAQTLVASFTSLLTSTFGHSVIVLTSSFLSLMACFWISLFVIFPEEDDSNSNGFNKSDKASFTLTI